MIDKLRPLTHLSSVAELNPELLQEQIPGLGAVVFDLDKTLSSQHEYDMPRSSIEALITIDALGLRLGIISNAASQERTSRVISMAGSLSNVVDHEIVVVTSRMVDGKKKPFRPVFNKMAEKLGLENAKLCYVGDQIFKDVLGANNAGYGGSVLVAPYGKGDDLRVRLLQRPAEACIRPLLGLPFLTKNFGQ